MVVHIIGAGLAGLSAAVHLTRQGVPVAVYEAAAHAGGRCRSFFDSKTQAELDNGTHLFMGANHELFSLLEICGVKSGAFVDEGTKIPFFNMKTKKFFQINLAHPLLSIFKAKRVLPLVVKSIMNTPKDQADMRMVFKTLYKCVQKDGNRVYLAKKSLNDAVVDPIVSYLRKNGAAIHFGHRLKAAYEEELVFFNKTVPLEKDDMVILALPAPALSKYVRDINEYATNTILNIHYKSNAVLKNGRSYAGLLHSSRADFVFVRNGVVSITVSAADALLAQYSPDMLAGLIWQDLAKVLVEPEKRPPYRVVVNKRATPVQTAEFNAGRPQTDIGDYVIFLASDFVQTGLPCTMESAVVAGMKAAQAVIDGL